MFLEVYMLVVHDMSCTYSMSCKHWYLVYLYIIHVCTNLNTYIIVHTHTHYLLGGDFQRGVDVSRGVEFEVPQSSLEEKK